MRKLSSIFSIIVTNLFMGTENVSALLGTKGRASLKKVLPALTDLSYNGLEIAEGNTASLKFMEAAFGNIPDEERRKIRTDLLTYCGQDTGGMIEILKNLQELAD
ncbi:MAG: hypothetical protein NTX46_04500 [Chloroflexi bacterium]|nr:hypothetical protein [Chloroflexota bacterium]